MAKKFGVQYHAKIFFLKFCPLPNHIYQTSFTFCRLEKENENIRHRDFINTTNKKRIYDNYFDMYNSN